MKALEDRSTPVGNEHRRRRWRGWIQLGLWLLVLWCGVFFIAPWLERWEPIRTMHEYINKNGIDATALFYTEVEEFREAEMAVRQSMTYGR